MLVTRRRNYGRLGPPRYYGPRINLRRLVRGAYGVRNRIDQALHRRFGKAADWAYHPYRAIGRNLHRLLPPWARKKRKRSITGPPAKRPRITRLPKYVDTTRYTGFSKFPRGRKHRTSIYNQRGALIHFEEAGIVDQNDDQDQALCIGHTTVYNDYLLRILCHALVRKLLHKRGVNVSNFNQHLQREGTVETQSALELRYSYTLREGTAHTYVAVNPGANASPADLADALVTSIEGVWNSTTDDAYDFVLETIEITQANAAERLRGARLRGPECHIHFYSESILKLQNRTLATTDGTDTHAESALHITNNPLVGKSYENSGNGFKPKYSGELSGTPHPFSGRPADGLINVDFTTWSTEGRAKFMHPVHPNSFEKHPKCVNVRMDPGKIRQSHIVTKKKMRVTDFLRAMFRLMTERTATAGHHYNNVGYSRMFLLEKEMDTDHVNEPQINVGYELNNTIGAVITEGPTFCDTIQERL